MLLRLAIDRVHSRAIGLQFVCIGKLSLALGDLFQLRKRSALEICWECKFTENFLPFYYVRSSRCGVCTSYLIVKSSTFDFILRANSKKEEILHIETRKISPHS